MGGEDPEVEPEAFLASEGRAGELVSDKYRIVRRLGQGGMAAVYEARHVVIDRRVALKFLHPLFASDRETLARFEREARTAGALESEHIAATLDFGRTTDGSPYIVMEYLSGEDLAQCLRRERALPIEEAVEVVRQACRGLAKAHAAGVIHRDLKPDNLFLCERADGALLVKILDFGIAKLRATSSQIGAATRPDLVIGSVPYMAPEQARGATSIDERTDTYSLGVILYEALTGEKPHPGDTYDAILYHLLSLLPVPVEQHRPDLPQELVDIVCQAIQDRSEDRFPSADALGDALSRFVGSSWDLSVAGVRPSTTPIPAQELASPIEPDAKGEMPYQLAESVSTTAGASAENGSLTLPTLTFAQAWGPILGLAAVVTLIVAVLWLGSGDQTESTESSASRTPAVTHENVTPFQPYATPLREPEAENEPVIQPIIEPSGMDEGPEPAEPPAAQGPRAVQALPTAGPGRARPSASYGGAKPPIPPVVLEEELAASPGNALLNVSSIPAATVILDGRVIGRTPKIGLAVSPGIHTVVLVHPELGRRSQTVDLKPGKVVRISNAFVDEAQSAAGGAYRANPYR